MKILMLTPYLPYPLISGGQIRSYNLLRILSQKHEITLVSLIKHDPEKHYVKNLKAFCQKVIVAKRPENPWTVRNVFKTGFSFWPFLVVRNFSPYARDQVIQELRQERFDMIHAETFYVMPHIPETSTPILLVEQTIEYLVYRHFVDTLKIPLLRWLFSIDVYKIRYWEEYYWKRATRVVAMSDSDRKVMRSRIASLDVSIVPNGVDTHFFTYKKKSISSRPKVLFVGNFKWLQNQEAVSELVRNIWPIISQEIPTATLWIVGRFPPRTILQLSGERIEVSDSIGDIRTAYSESDVLLAPIYGPGGTRYKILEAMASGLPVVTTPQGIEGLGVRDGIEALVRKDSLALAEATIELLRNSSLYQQLAKEANGFVRKNYNWEVIAGSLDKIYEAVAHEKVH